MNLRILKMTLRDFKGCKSAEYLFKGNTKIKGANGCGKSTVMSAAIWCLSDMDSKLIKNPDIAPIGLDTSDPTVEIEFLLDEKPLVVSKQQKFRRKIQDGKTTSSVTNSYSINGIEKSYRNFIEDLKERGIDMDKFIYFTHPDAFTADVSAKGREKIREILFGMIESVSDEEIAKTLNVPELYDLLSSKGYKIEEVESLTKSNLRKLNDKYGKSNELIYTRIAEINASKSDKDIKVLQEQKKSYEAEIDRCEQELLNISNGKADIHKKLSELRIKKQEIETNSNLQLNNERAEIEKNIRDFSSIISENDFRLSKVKSDIERTELLLSEANQDIENQRIKYKVEQDSVLDESDLSCPCCFRPYEADKLAEIKANFEKNKAEKLSSIKTMGDEIKSKIKSYEHTIDELSKNKGNLENVIQDTLKMRDDESNRLNALPESVDLSTNKEYTNIIEQIELLEKELDKSDESRKEDLESSRNVAKEMLYNITEEIGVCEHNKVLDERIEALKAEKKEAEIQRANNEKILSQLQTFIQAKNDLLTSKINEKFSLVQWHLYEYQKNGDIKPVCEPYIDGKPMTSAANGSLITLAKISICADLQKHFEQIMPIWVEDYSLFSSNTESRIDTESQIIGLVVTEDQTLQIEKGE